MAAHEHEPLGGKLLTLPFVTFVGVFLIAAYILLQRFVFGLAEVTNLSGGYPWGIWIAIDLIIGTAFGCGGLVMALLVYILNRGEYHPMVRAGLMTSLFGYTLGALAVMIDLGRWWQGYNILLPWLWNPNSVLLETALCIFLYIMVLMVEFSPAVFERFGMREAHRKVTRVLFIFTALGVLLPMMHQSSMGTVVVILGYKLSPLWQSPLLTLNFLFTALTMGFAVVAFESILASVAFKRPYESSLLAKLTGVMVWVMTVYMVIRFGDVVLRGNLGYAFAFDIPAISFWIEILSGVAAIVLLLPPANRLQPRYVFIGATAMLFNGFLFRLNCYLIGFDPGGGWSYFPSAGEILVTLGIVALHLVLYLIFVKQLPVLHAVRREPGVPGQ